MTKLSTQQILLSKATNIKVPEYAQMRQDYPLLTFTEPSVWIAYKAWFAVVTLNTAGRRSAPSALTDFTVGAHCHTQHHFVKLVDFTHVLTC